MAKIRIMLICGSPRKGNSEAIIKEVEKYLQKKGVATQLVLLRKKNIGLCEGCVEFCNQHLYCKKDKQDDMGKILQMMKKTNGFVIVAPTYFSMPPAILKNFMDRCSILFTAGVDLTKKAASVIAIGTDLPSIGVNAHNLMTYCHVHGMLLVDSLHLIGKSNLYKDYKHILKSKANTNLQDKLRKFSFRLDDVCQKLNKK